MLPLFLLLFLLPIGNAWGEQPKPLRAGIDVPQPKIVKSVPVSYPQWGSKTEARMVLNIIIDEQGAVTDISDASNNPIYYEAYYDAAKSSVKQWRFSPTFVDGKAVPVSTTIAIIFISGRAPMPLDWHSSIGMPNGNRATICSFVVRMDRSGNLKEEPDDKVVANYESDGLKEMSRREFCGTERYFILFPDPDVPFSLVEEKMKTQEPFAFSLLETPQYRFPKSDSPDIDYAQPGLKRLYYSTMVVGDDSIIQLAGIDPEVKPPKFTTDFANLAGPLDVLRDRWGIAFFYTLFVDETGSILGIESSGTKNEAVERALSKAVVITPGIRNGKPVPTAVTVAIPSK